MPRRLGESPLARAKARPAVDPAKTGKPSSTSNDVFFSRRADDAVSPQVAAPVPELPEITEISEIPEIREVATSQSIVQQPGPIDAPAPAASSSVVEVAAKTSETPVRPSQPEAVSIPVGRAIDVESDPTFQDDGGFLKRLLEKLRK